MPNQNGLGTIWRRGATFKKVRPDSPIYRFPTRNGKAHPRPGWGFSPARPLSKKRGIPVIAYDTALTESAYGKPEQLGDLFNDVMGAVVPGWDQRPAWMKKIQIKPDPTKILQQAQKVVPPSQIENLLNIGQQYGISPYYSGMEVTPGAGRALYTGAPLATALGAVPGWAWLAGGGVLILLFMRR